MCGKGKGRTEYAVGELFPMLITEEKEQVDKYNLE
jgi:hypothetical protein